MQIASCPKPTLLLSIILKRSGCILLQGWDIQHLCFKAIKTTLIEHSVEVEFVCNYRRDPYAYSGLFISLIHVVITCMDVVRQFFENASPPIPIFQFVTCSTP